jgi:type I restriction enzyme S subunit
MWCTKPIKIAKDNDILISVRAPVGKVNICNLEKLVIGRGLASIRPKNGVDHMYLFYFLKYYENKWTGIERGSVFGSITKNELENLEIPLPPLEEQRKIAEYLQNLQEKILKLKEHRKQILSMLEELKLSILNKVFQMQQQT